LGSQMTNDEAILPQEDSYFFATFDWKESTLMTSTTQS
jgi:hypothetical protein